MRAKCFLMFAGVLSVLWLAGAAGAETILVDVGALPDPTPGNWNNLTQRWTTDGGIDDLIDDAGASTGISLYTTVDFMERTTNGWAQATIDYPETAKTDAFFVGAGSTGQLALGNLNTSLEYTVTLFGASGDNGTADKRWTEFTIAGATSESGAYQAWKNNDTVFTATMMPNAQGNITIDVTSPADQQYGGLNVVEVNYVPEPASGALLAILIVGAGAISRRGRD